MIIMIEPNKIANKITEWLCSTGFLFPRNEVELERFNLLYEDQNPELTGTEIDPDVILNSTFKKDKS